MTSFLDSASQVIIFKQKDYVDKIFIAKGYQCIHSSGEGESCSDLRCKIAVIKGDHMFDEKSTSKILSLADDTNRHRVTMDANIDDAFYARKL